MAKEDDSTIVEEKLTTDGIENYGFGESYGETNNEKLANRKKRKFAGVMWSPNSKHFVVTRTDSRSVKDLWVINSIAEPRPTLKPINTICLRKEAPVREMMVFDMAAKKWKKLMFPNSRTRSLGSGLPMLKKGHAKMSTVQ